MPNALSKLKDSVYGREWSFPYNCYEVGHGWTPYCSDAALGVGLSAFEQSLPLYTSLYLFTQLGLQRKYDPEAFMETFKSILTSASFLSFNMLAGMGTSCLLRCNSDRYYYRIQCFLPGFIASYLALLIERPSRRPALAFYLANMSSELLYKWSESRGYVRSLPHGETILFAAGMACWLRFVRVHGFGHDPVSTALKYLIGPLEAKSRARTKPQHQQVAPGQLVGSDGSQAPPEGTFENVTTSTERRKKGNRLSAMGKIEEGVTSILNQFFGCHEICPHKGISCVDYSLTPMVTRFAMAYTARSLLNLVPNHRILLKNPTRAFRIAFTAQSSINMGLFMGTFVGATKAIHCILRRATGKQEDWHSAVAGAISGASMAFSPKSTLSTYIIWKCLEQYFFLAVKNGQIKRQNEVIGLVYAVSVNVLLYIFALEPRFIRPSYMKFIDKISGHRLHQVNRMGKFVSSGWTLA